MFLSFLGGAVVLFAVSCLLVVVWLAESVLLLPLAWHNADKDKVIKTGKRKSDLLMANWLR
jgi:hypothetical protein